MRNKVSLLKEIDAAIDALDESKIEAGLQALAALEPQPIQAEDNKLFAARIQKLKKEQTVMRKPLKSMRIAIVAGALLLTGLTAYAADALNLFSFQQGDRFVTFRTTDNMTEQQARELVGEDAAIAAPPEGTLQPESEDFTFETLAQAEETLGMVIPLPAALPQMRLDSATASVYHYGEGRQSKIAWITYADEQERMFGITVTREIVPPGGSLTSYSTNDIDEGSLGSYKSTSGIEYTTLSESDDTGSLTAHIATTMIGEYEYSLVFVGFDEAERQAIIDSADLSLYQ